jgi:hypothetical protein
VGLQDHVGQNLEKMQLETLKRLSLRLSINVKTVVSYTELLILPVLCVCVRARARNLASHAKRRAQTEVIWEERTHTERVTIQFLLHALWQTTQPLMIVFKDKRLTPEWGNLMQPGTTTVVSAKATMTSDISKQWIHNLQNIGYLEIRPLLLLKDVCPN